MSKVHQHINPLHVNQKNQINQWFRQTTPTGKCLHTGKMNSIDNQRVTSKKTKLTGNKPVNLEIKNKLDMTLKLQQLHISNPKILKSYQSCSRQTTPPENAYLPEK